MDQDRIKAGFLNLKKSIFCLGNRLSPSKRLILNLWTKRSAKLRVTKSAQKTDATIPMAIVKPKPLTGPVPNQKRINAVIKVVTFASRMVDITLLNPAFKLPSGDLPRRRSSRIRSKIRILASTPIPKVKTNAATPGKVSVAPRLASTPKTKVTLTKDESTAIKPPKK